jgi:hypothetical protein
MDEIGIRRDAITELRVIREFAEQLPVVIRRINNEHSCARFNAKFLREGSSRVAGHS